MDWFIAHAGEARLLQHMHALKCTWAPLGMSTVATVNSCAWAFGARATSLSISPIAAEHSESTSACGLLPKVALYDTTKFQRNPPPPPGPARLYYKRRTPWATPIPNGLPNNFYKIIY